MVTLSMIHLFLLFLKLFFYGKEEDRVVFRADENHRKLVFKPGIAQDIRGLLHHNDHPQNLIHTRRFHLERLRVADRADRNYLFYDFEGATFKKSPLVVCM